MTNLNMPPRQTSRRYSVLIALLALVSVLGAACASDGGTDAESASDGDFLACQVSDTGGIDDKSFNETAYQGLTRAEADLGVEISFLESQAVTDFRPNIDSFVSRNCDVIITVGFLLGDDTAAAAKDNPDQQFAIVDYNYEPAIDNVRALLFETDEAAFLAGYLAAGTSQTGKVGTFGGINIPTVTIFMDGFVSGVRHYNSVNGTSVDVLGWDGNEGLFTGNFESTDDGRAFGENLISEGADVIMPVAGPVGLGTAAAAQAAGDVTIVGVDSDWFDSASDFSDVILTSVRKNMDTAVYDTVATHQAGDDVGTLFLGTLANEGVGLGRIADGVDNALIDEVEALRQDIVDGAVTVELG